jgi:multiple sugar transport system substrate-binding protein
MKKLITGLLTATTITFSAGAACAAEVTLDVYYAFPNFAKFYEPLARDFMKEHPEINIKFRAPAASYDEGQQAMLRAAITNELPDVYFAGFNLLAELVAKLEPRKQIVDLGPFLAAETAEWRAKNYEPNVLDLARVNGKLYGMPFNASLPIVFVNDDLVKKAGGDPKNLPDNWPALIDLAVKIKGTGAGVGGLSYAVHDWPGDWLWRSMITQGGGKMVDGTKVAFGDKTGLTALTYFRRFVTEAGMPLMGAEQSQQAFVAGQLGFYFETPAKIAQMETLVGTRFKLSTAVFPVDNKATGGLPVGGNAGVVTARDPAKQKAAWEFLKFATSAGQQAAVVKSSGYMPTNKDAGGANFLGPFFESNPNYRTLAAEIKYAQPWQGYPGGNSVRIWRAQRDIINSVTRGDITPEAGLKKIVEETQALIE